MEFEKHIQQWVLIDNQIKLITPTEKKNETKT